MPLLKLISEITKIPVAVFVSPLDLGNYSIAQRMSWAANRVTTRPEDEAYCLLGIFDVSMPLLYGEGRKAFIRLQEEIMKTSTDHSIFAWRGDQKEDFLAHKPNMFKDCGRIISGGSYLRGGVEHYHTNNRGLSITLEIRKVKSATKTDVVAAMLNCYHDPEPGEYLDSYIGISLTHMKPYIAPFKDPFREYKILSGKRRISTVGKASAGATMKTISILRGAHYEPPVRSP